MAAIDDRGQFGTRRSALARGIAVAFGVPGLILFASAAGFGALARDAGLSLGNANLMMATLFALPAQVVMVDQLARGGSLLGAALAVTLIGVRLLPMTAVLAPHLGGPSAGRLASSTGERGDARPRHHRHGQVLGQAAAGVPGVGAEGVDVAAATAGPAS